MPPTKDTPSVLAAGFELIKHYPGEEQVRLKVVVEIPGSDEQSDDADADEGEAGDAMQTE